ncbi:MAG: TonB family protein [bacterium]|jgi:protein TonB
MRLTWKAWVLAGSVAFHLLLFAILKVPVILARSPQVALIFNFSEPPKIEQPKPEPPKTKPPKIEEKKREERKQEPEKKQNEPPPPPKAPEPMPSDLVDDGRPVVNPEPDGVPEGEAGGVPGGTPGGTGTAEPAPATPEPGPKPEPPPEPEKPKVDTAAILSKYTSSVKSKVQGAKFYPEQAKRMEHEGSVKVRFTVTASGGVSGVSVASSSGFSDLDSAAVQAVQNAAPFGAIPEELGKSSLTMTVTLNYKLN